jgi:hypothetical protein
MHFETARCKTSGKRQQASPKLFTTARECRCSFAKIRLRSTTFRKIRERWPHIRRLIEEAKDFSELQAAFDTFLKVDFLPALPTSQASSEVFRAATKFALVAFGGESIQGVA